MKHLENFKSETIQSIYDFLEQDADVNNFKRDLIAVSEYKKIPLHDLEAQYFEYHDLMKEDLSDKIVFIFREDGYLGMFGDSQIFTNWVSVKKSLDEYKKLKDGDRVLVKHKYGEYEEGIINIYHGNYIMYFSKKMGGLWTLSDNNYVYTDHTNIKKITSLIHNLIIDEKEIKELKMTMHFALVI